jgi:hypothetical protein
MLRQEKKSSLRPLLKSLEKEWPVFEVNLQNVANYSGFSEFLSRYRGVVEDTFQDDSRRALGIQISDELSSLVRRALSSVDPIQNWSEESAFSEMLKALEGAINLLLYFWHAPEERNFQFRTVVHFTQLSDQPVLQSLEGYIPFFFRVTEWGLQLSVNDVFEPLPYRYSVARACDLKSLMWDDNKDPKNAAHTLAKLRVIQREFCQLIDEWEHCNSILAVRQYALRKRPPTEQNDFQMANAEVFRTRDLFAQWCAASVSDFQEIVSDGLSKDEASLHPDVRAELLATNALLLSGFQKFFLPASVSRHIYDSIVVSEFDRFMSERLRAEPDDLCSLLSRISFSVALNRKADWSSVIDFLGGKSFCWSLSADPSAAIKSMAWSYTLDEHLLLVACFIVCLQAKHEPNQLDFFWLQSIASVIEMPSTFVKNRISTRNHILANADAQNLLSRAIECLSHFSGVDNDETNKTYEYVREFLSACHFEEPAGS